MFVKDDRLALTFDAAAYFLEGWKSPSGAKAGGLSGGASHSSAPPRRTEPLRCTAIDKASTLTLRCVHGSQLRVDLVPGASLEKRGSVLAGVSRCTTGRIPVVVITHVGVDDAPQATRRDARHAGTSPAKATPVDKSDKIGRLDHPVVMGRFECDPLGDSGELPLFIPTPRAESPELLQVAVEQMAGLVVLIRGHQSAMTGTSSTEPPIDHIQRIPHGYLVGMKWVVVPPTQSCRTHPTDNDLDARSRQSRKSIPVQRDSKLDREIREVSLPLKNLVAVELGLRAKP